MAVSDEVKELVLWRLRHGETEQGRPFYDKAGFGQWCDLVNVANQGTEEGKESAHVSPAGVEEMHRAFVHAEDGDLPALEEWKSMCDALKETARIEGGLDAPLRDSGERALHRQAALGHVQNLSWLVQNGADVNAVTAPSLELSPNGGSSSSLCPVHVAAIYGQIGALAVLREAGADLNCRRPDGVTPLDFAEDTEQPEAAAWLQTRGGIRGLQGESV
mmetsp:Transcript_30500/g.48907  ORF Transcript_30500/g.48907 Transcript_30500/m.48907 type:complete len:218 (+) Transcript_30500:55-708(+)